MYRILCVRKFESQQKWFLIIFFWFLRHVTENFQDLLAFCNASDKSIEHRVAKIATNL